MAISKNAVRHLGVRLQIVEALLNLVLQDLPATLGENVIENMSVLERRALREKMALYRGLIQTVRAKGSANATAGDLTRDDIGRLYFEAQAAMGRLGDSSRKLHALSANAFEDAPISAEQKTIWETKLNDALGELDTHVAAFPGETAPGAEEE